jgi:hypothetical protein
MANEMHLELSTKKPFAKARFLALRKNKIITPVSFWSRLANGQESEFQYIPIQSYRFSDSTIQITLIDQQKPVSYNLASIVYPIADASAITYSQQSFQLHTRWANNKD